MEFDLAQTKARLEEALEQVKSVHQAVMVNLPCVVEVSFCNIPPQGLTGLIGYSYQ